MMKFRRLVSCILSVCLMLPGISVAAAEQKDEKEYALLYSMTGYATNGTKRAYLRQLTDAPKTFPEAWTLYRIGNEEDLSSLRTECDGLLDEAYQKWILAKSDTIALQEAFHQEPLTFKTTVLSADFSAVSKKGVYAIVSQLKSGELLISKPFVITDAPLSNELLPQLAIHNAQARYAGDTYFGGFYDCNSRFGEAYSHGTFLSGLSNYSLYGGSALSAEDRQQLQWAAQVGFDYLMNIHTEKTGQIRYSAPERPGDKEHNEGLHNSIEAVCGLSAYMDAFSKTDPERVTEENRQKILKTVAYIEDQLGANPNNYEWKTSVMCHLYRAFQHEEDLLAARASAEITLQHLDWEHTARGNVVSPFEGLWLLSQIDADFINTPALQEKLLLWKTDIAKILEKSAYQFPTFSGPWDVMYRMSLSSYIGSWGIMWCLNQSVLGMALDACFLWELTGDDSFEKMAAGALNYVTGLNFGFTPDMCTKRTATNEAVTCASFAANSYGGVVPWDLWQFGMKNDQWASIVNGYTFEQDHYLYTNADWQHGETFVRMDGAMLYAGSLYEMLVNLKK